MKLATNLQFLYYSVLANLSICRDDIENTTEIYQEYIKIVPKIVSESCINTLYCIAGNFSGQNFHGWLQK